MKFFDRILERKYYLPLPDKNPFEILFQLLEKTNFPKNVIINVQNIPLLLQKPECILDKVISLIDEFIKTLMLINI
jgi:hypothetical protein